MVKESKYIKFIERNNPPENPIQYEIYNFKQDVTIGWIVRRRVGRFMHWCLEPVDYGSDTYFTNGCLKEIREFITEQYSKGQKLKEEAKE